MSQVELFLLGLMTAWMAPLIFVGILLRKAPLIDE
jgi:hypothetical protein